MMVMAVTLTTLITLLSVLSTASCGRVMVGGKTEVTNVRTNRKIQELGKFAVKEYNVRLRQSDDIEGGSEPWKFVEVVQAQQQVVSGVKYYLNIIATRNGVQRMFTSVVVVKPWVEYKKVLHFGPSSDFQQDISA